MLLLFLQIESYSYVENHIIYQFYYETITMPSSPIKLNSYFSRKICYICLR